MTSSLDSSFSGGVQSGFGSIGVPPSVSSTSSTGSTSPEILTGISTLTPSDKEKIEKAIEAGVPFLVSPFISPSDFYSFFIDSSGGPSAIAAVGGGDMTVFLMKTQLELQKIANSVLDKWSESIQKEKEALEEELRSPRYQRWLEDNSAAGIAKQEAKKALVPLDPYIFEKYLNQLPSMERLPIQEHWNYYKSVTAQVEGLKALGASLTELANKSPDPSKAAEWNVVTSAIVIAGAGTMTGVLIPDVNLSNQIAVNPILDSANIINPVAQQAPAPAMFQINNLINFFAVPLMAYSAAETLGGARNTGQKPSPEDVAKEFAAKIVNLVTSSDAFNVILNQIIVQRYSSGEPLLPKQREQLAVEVKITFLAMALALLYKTALKDAAWIQSGDFKGILDGTIPVKKGSIEATIRDFIMGTKGKPGLIDEIDPERRDVFLASLLSFMDTNPGFDKLLNPYVRVFDILFPPPLKTSETRA